MRLVTIWTGHAGHIWCLEFTPDGKGMFCGSTDGILKYWDVSSLGDKDPEEIRRFVGNTVRVLAVSFCLFGLACLEFPSIFREHSRWVLTSTDDRNVRLWDTELDDWVLNLRGHTDVVTDVGVSRTEDYLATASGHMVTIWKYDVL